MINTITNQTRLYDPAPPLTAGGGVPSGTTTLAKIPLDTTDHNVESDPADIPAESPVFDFGEITSTDGVKDSSAKLPSNTGKPTTTKKPQKFAENPAPEEKSEEVDPNADETPADEARRAEDASKKPSDDGEKINSGKDVVAPAADPAAPNNLPKDRDYNGFDPEEVKILKNMKNDHFHIMTRKLAGYKAEAKKAAEMELKVKELSKTLEERGTPPSYYDHPEAFTLTPEYRDLSAKFDRVSAEQEHYEQQLVNIKSARPFQMIRGYDKNGNMILTEPMEASTQGEVHVMGLLQKYGAAEQTVRGQVATLQANFRNTHNQAATAVISELDRHINNMIPELRPVEKDINNYTGVIPAPFRDHPMTKVAAKQFGIIIKQAEMLAAYKQKETTSARIKADVAAASPDTKTLPRTGPAPGSNGKTIKLPNGKVVPAEFDMADFGGD